MHLLLLYTGMFAVACDMFEQTSKFDFCRHNTIDGRSCVDFHSIQCSQTQHTINKMLEWENQHLYNKLGLRWKLKKQQCDNNSMLEYVLVIEFLPKIAIYRPDWVRSIVDGTEWSATQSIIFTIIIIIRSNGIRSDDGQLRSWILFYFYFL